MSLETWWQCNKDNKLKFIWWIVPNLLENIQTSMLAMRDVWAVFIHVCDWSLIRIMIFNWLIHWKSTFLFHTLSILHQRGNNLNLNHISLLTTQQYHHSWTIWFKLMVQKVCFIFCCTCNYIHTQKRCTYTI